MAGSIRPRLASAVSKLKEYGDHDEAAAVAALMGPRGYLLLQRTETGDTDLLSISVSDSLKKTVQEALEQFDQVLDSLSDEAYRKVRDEGWVPPKVARFGRGQRGGTNVVLQTRVDSKLRRDVQEMLPALSEQAGYRITEGGLVLTHVCEELGIERTAEEREPVDVRLPRHVRAFFQEEAARQGVELREVAVDGIRRLLDGSWSPDWASVKPGREADKVSLKVRVPKDLEGELRAHLVGVSERAGFQVSPALVLRAVFGVRLGEPGV
ncbi:hypothetical protein ACWGOK_36135 [Streptomyces eurythermus]